MRSPWRRKWQPTPVFLPAEFHGQRSLADYSPWGSKESDMTKWLTHKHMIIYTFYMFSKVQDRIHGERRKGVSCGSHEIANNNKKFLSLVEGQRYCPSRLFSFRFPGATMKLHWPACAFFFPKNDCKVGYNLQIETAANWPLPRSKPSDWFSPVSLITPVIQKNRAGHPPPDPNHCMWFLLIKCKAVPGPS